MRSNTLHSHHILTILEEKWEEKRKMKKKEKETKAQEEIKKKTSGRGKIKEKNLSDSRWLEERVKVNVVCKYGWNEIRCEDSQRNAQLGAFRNQKVCGQPLYNSGDSIWTEQPCRGPDLGQRGQSEHWKASLWNLDLWPEKTGSIAGNAGNRRPQGVQEKRKKKGNGKN